MGSIFTFGTDVLNISSPWLDADKLRSDSETSLSDIPQGQRLVLSDYNIAKLQPEPHDGPIEYKLHLLLRPRRTYLWMSTQNPSSSATVTLGDGQVQTVFPALSSSSQTRQARFEQLTTQLLWRLQQSCPFNSATNKTVELPQLPEGGVDLDAVIVPSRLVPGLEESRGALYEIGVLDDGTLIGLAQDELDESIAALRVMAASLGCEVRVLRTVVVGSGEWVVATDDGPQTRRGELLVAEASVIVGSLTAETRDGFGFEQSSTDQLRISLTGATTSGKSTLLGTLSSGILDDGRGKSRQNMLRHRHEVNSGVTSSVSQELVGYKDGVIFSYAQADIESWADIHNGSKGGRLVFMSDAGGHIRYRRTVVRGLVGRDPHWTVLCVSGEDDDDAPSWSMASTPDDGRTYSPGIPDKTVDLAQAHLQLCLTLQRPLAVVVTKLDLATKDGLRRVLGKVLTTIKAAGRTPRIIQPDQKSHPNLTSIPPEDHARVKELVGSIGGYANALQCVPILLTSAVKGTGLGLVHALFESLPLPPQPTSTDYVGLALNPEQPTTLFHIDDTFALPLAVPASANEGSTHMGIVVSGHLRFGDLAVGDQVVVGPFDAEDDGSGSPRPDGGLSVSHPSSSELARLATLNAVSAASVKGQWYDARVSSIRNLRLPVHSLNAGQVGSIGIQFIPTANGGSSSSSSTDHSTSGPVRLTIPRIRRGMILAIPSRHMIDSGLSLQAASSVTASFTDPSVRFLTVGSLVNIYAGSVAAAARVQNIVIGDASSPHPVAHAEDVFGLEEHIDSGESAQNSFALETTVQISLELLNRREWIELGSRILILESGRHDKSGLEGFLGKVFEIED